MKRIVSVVTFVLLMIRIAASLTAQIELPEGFKAPYADPPTLELKFKDDFSKDTRSEFQISGRKDAVNWEKGRLTLGNGAFLQKGLDAGDWVELEVDLEFPSLTENGQTSELKVWLDLEGATDSFVWFRQKREKGKNRSAIFIVDTDGEWNRTTKRSVIRKPLVFDKPLDNGVWQIRYRKGLWMASSPNHQMLAGYLENGKSAVNGLLIETTNLPAGLRSITCKQSARFQFDPSPEMKARIKKFNAISEEMVKFFRTKRMDNAIEQAKKVVKNHRSLLGAYHPDFPQNLFNLAGLYRIKAEYAKAAPYCEMAIQIKEKTHGKDHPIYAQSLNNLGALFASMGQLDKAEPLLIQALKIEKQALGMEHRSYLAHLNNLSAIYVSKGQFKKAEPLILQLKETRGAILGKDHPDYATSLNALAALYQSTGRLAEAEPLYLRAKTIREKSLGTSHPEYASTLNALGTLYASMSQFEEARPLLLQAGQIRKKVLGATHPEYAASLKDLAGVYREIGDFGEAESLYLQARSIMRSVLGNTHPDLADCLNHLAGTYALMGDFHKAESLYLKANEIWKKTLGVTHPAYAASLNNLAALYQAIGHLEKASLLYQQAREIWETVLGKEHPNYAASLNNLAAIHQSAGQHEKAELYFLQARKIEEKVFGKKHPQYATGLCNLAELYLSMRQFDKAEPLYQQALEIRKQVLGEGHPDYAYSLNNLAYLYHSKGDLARAEMHYQKAKEIFENVLGNQHPDLAVSLSNLAYLYQSKKNNAEASRLFRRITSITQNNQERYSVIQSEKQRREYAKSFQHHFSAYISNALKLKGEEKAVWDKALQWKGMSLVRQKQSLTLSTLPETREAFAELKSIRSRMSKLLRSNPGSTGWKERIAKLESSEELVEKKLARIIAGLESKPVFDSKMELSLPLNTCLIDFRRFWSLEPESGNHSSFTSEPHYLALIRTPGGMVEMLDLGSADRIESAISRWRGPIEAANRNRRSMDLVGQRKMDQAGAELRKLVWNPLEEKIGRSELVIVSPDGALGRLPLIALPGKVPGTYLLEERKIVYLAVPALLPQMLSKPAPRIDRTSKALLVGAIDYGQKAGASAPDRLSFRNRRILKDLQFGALKNAAAEVKGIARLFDQPAELTGRQATEAAFQSQIKDHVVLHIGTHGFFQSPDRFMQNLPSENQAGLVSAVEQMKVMTENPDLLSGLALAGANSASGKPIDQAGNDGILYSAEIAMMPMDQVELAVLSACETSLGTDDNPGEGLIGIQRAFQVAGVKSTIASYWQVDDRATQMLMNRFYQNLLTARKKEGVFGQNAVSTTHRIDALIEAQRWMLRGLNKQQVAELTLRGIEEGGVKDIINKKKASKSEGAEFVSHPRYWAAFVLSGDWR